MQIICPECKFAREVDENKIPARSQVATCPKCQTKFKFRDLPEPEFLIEEPVESEPAPEPPVVPVAKPAPRPEPVAPARPSEPERAFPDLVDPDEDSGDALWQRLHKMTPPQNGRTGGTEPDTDWKAPEQDNEIQPVEGWTGEFNADFPDPMNTDTFEEEDQSEIPMQVPPPFEQLDRYGFFHGLFMTMKLVLFSPRLFFSVMPVGNGLSKPLTFAILVAMIQSVCQYAWGTAGLVPGLEISDKGILVVPYNTSTGLFELLFTPALVAISLFAISGFYHAILSLLKGGDKGFEGSFRAVAYAYAPMILGIVPTFTLEFMLGWMALYTLLGVALTAIGLKHIHGSTYGKVIPALILPPLVFIVAALLLARAQMPSV